VIALAARRRVQIATAALTVAFLLFPAQAAYAHAVLVGSTPRDGATVSTLPDQVTFTFNENVATPAFVIVTAPDGDNVAVGEPTILDNTVSQRVDPPGEAGTYEMSYRVVSADGHPVSATLSFDVTSGRHVAERTSPSADAGGDSHRDLIVAVALGVVVVVIAIFALGRGRRSDDERGGSEPSS
jgi:methionine-rich copper-binding protein CopC